MLSICSHFLSHLLCITCAKILIHWLISFIYQDSQSATTIYQNMILGQSQDGQTLDRPMVDKTNPGQTNVTQDRVKSWTDESWMETFL